MKALLYLLAVLTWIFAIVAWAGVEGSAVREAVAVSLWIATAVLLGAAAICGKIGQLAAAVAASAKAAERNAPPSPVVTLPAAPPSTAEFDPAKAVDTMLANRARR